MRTHRRSSSESTARGARSRFPRLCLAAIAVAALAFAGCSDDSSDDDSSTTTTAAELANPASEYCVEQGGTVENRETEAGEEGICVFPDGSEVDEWEYFNGEAEPTQP